VAIDLQVHKHIPQHGMIASSDLADIVGADESLLSVFSLIFRKPNHG
jgi:hypothetical protein